MESIIEQIWRCTENRDMNKVILQVRNYIWDIVYRRVCNQTHQIVIGQVKNEVYGLIRINQIRDQTREQIADRLVNR